MFETIIALNYFIAWCLGAYTVFHSACFVAKMLIRNYMRKPLDLTDRYGKGTWALVTGATGGIGQAYCVELAKNGFNIILLGRSKERLEESEKIVKEANKQIKTKLVVADLGESLAVDFYKDIISQVSDLDISVLVNNAGWGEVGFFELAPLEEHLSNFRVNAAAPVMLIHNLINTLMKRNKKSAIVNVSSSGQNCPIPYMGVYNATKRYLSIFSYYLQDNYGDKIDVQDLCPAYVTTKIVKNYKGNDAITPERCAQCSLRDLGQEQICIPVIAHSIYNQVFHLYYRHLKPVYKIALVGFMEKLALRRFFQEHKKKD